jgi:glycosyltransferase involved in cell wall biosynthesis
MGRKQDLGNVLAAARLADERGHAVRFVLMGNGGERRRLEEEAFGVRAVTFLDPLPGNEFQEALGAADVLLVNEHAGLREMAVPSKLTSYFSSGRPVLAASDAESVTSEEIAVSEGGVRVDPGRPDLLVEAALALGGDVELADRLGAAGLRYQRTTLSEAAAIDAFAGLLGRLVDGSHRPPLAVRVRDILPSGRVLEH